MGIVYEVCAEGSWREVSCKEYEHFQGRRRIRPAGVKAGFQEVTSLLFAYSGRL